MWIPVMSPLAAELYRAYVASQMPDPERFDGSATPSMAEGCAVCHKIDRILCRPGSNLTKLTAIASKWHIYLMVGIFC